MKLNTLEENFMQKEPVIHRESMMEPLETRLHLNSATFESSFHKAWTLSDRVVATQRAMLKPVVRHQSAFLPNPSQTTAAVAFGNKVFIADRNDPVAETAYIDVYDLVTRKWSAVRLPDFSYSEFGLNLNGKAAFAWHDNNGIKIDIYDPNTEQWSTSTSPSSPSPTLAAVALDNKAYFLSGSGTVELDVFDASTGQWSNIPSTLPLGSANYDATKLTLVGRTIFFSSNTFGKIGSYNTDTGQWSLIQIGRTSDLPSSYLQTTGPITAAGTQVFVAVGNTRDVYVYDTVTGRSNVIRAPADFPPASESFELASLGTKVIFPITTVGLVAIYDTRTKEWASASFNSPGGLIRALVTVSASGTHAIFSGGYLFDPHISGEYQGPSSSVDIYTDTSPQPVLSGTLAGTVGQPVAVTVRNTGDSPLRGGFSVRLYESPDRTLKHAVLVGRLNVKSPLAAGTFSDFMIPTAISSRIRSGNRHLLAAVEDARGKITPIAAEDNIG